MEMSDKSVTRPWRNDHTAAKIIAMAGKDRTRSIFAAAPVADSRLFEKHTFHKQQIY